ncbi:MAG TPA: hypothetical protein DCY89_04235 [Gammaproteobacteria bacterium]|nr:hypothetical protein [Gammaproteobacteria bacterium]
MKVTIEVPDDLYRKVKAKSALLGKPVREVTVELYRRWIEGPEAAPAPAGTDWLDEFRKLQVPADGAGPTARDILEAGRKRLERGGQ